MATKRRVCRLLCANPRRSQLQQQLPQVPFRILGLPLELSAAHRKACNGDLTHSSTPGVDRRAVFQIEVVSPRKKSCFQAGRPASAGRRDRHTGSHIGKPGSLTFGPSGAKLLIPCVDPGRLDVSQHVVPAHVRIHRIQSARVRRCTRSLGPLPWGSLRTAGRMSVSDSARSGRPGHPGCTRALGPGLRHRGREATGEERRRTGARKHGSQQPEGRQ